MLDDTNFPATGTGIQRVLANRLFLLAADTDRVGLHQEANLLAHVAASVLEGRRITIRDA